VSILPSKGEKTMETTTIQTTEFESTHAINPREAKLKDIIEKGKASLHKTLEEIQHEFSIREDMAVRPTAIDFLKATLDPAPLSLESEPHKRPNPPRPLQAHCEYQQVVIKRNRLANMEATQKDPGGYERAFQN
jgi:hypothetical protein